MLKMRYTDTFTEQQLVDMFLHHGMLQFLPGSHMYNQFFPYTRKSYNMFPMEIPLKKYF